MSGQESAHLWMLASLTNDSIDMVPDEDLAIHACCDGHRQDRAEDHIFNAVRMTCKATPNKRSSMLP